MCVGLPKTAEHLFLAALFFISFFWASKRKKGIKSDFNISKEFFPFFFPWWKKVIWRITKKRSRQNRMLRRFCRPAHKKSILIVITLCYCTDRTKTLFHVQLKTRKALCPDLLFRSMKYLLIWHRDKALYHSTINNRTLPLPRVKLPISTKNKRIFNFCL